MLDNRGLCLDLGRRSLTRSMGGGAVPICCDVGCEPLVLCSPVVPGYSGEGGGEFGESSVPGSESGAEYAQWVVCAAEGVAAVVVGLVGVVVDGPEQCGGAGAGVPPWLEQRPGAPQGYPGYPFVV